MQNQVYELPLYHCYCQAFGKGHNVALLINVHNFNISNVNIAESKWKTWMKTSPVWADNHDDFVVWNYLRWNRYVPSQAGSDSPLGRTALQKLWPSISYRHCILIKTLQFTGSVPCIAFRKYQTLSQSNIFTIAYWIYLEWLADRSIFLIKVTFLY